MYYCCTHFIHNIAGSTLSNPNMCTIYYILVYLNLDYLNPQIPELNFKCSNYIH